MSDIKAFEETPAYLERVEKYEQDKSSLENDMYFRLKERGRETAKYPDDSDLIDWYNDELEHLMKWFYRDVEDLKEEYRHAR